jgi:hypothetical protein
MTGAAFSRATVGPVRMEIVIVRDELDASEDAVGVACLPRERSD